MLKSLVYTIVNSPVLFFATFFLTRACIWTVVEMIGALDPPRTRR
ncbi:hypothetical protein [Roseiarcus sp.]